MGPSSLAGPPKDLIEKPSYLAGMPLDDVLSGLLRNIRVSGTLQFCMIAGGDWQTDAVPRLGMQSGRTNATMPFHVLVEGDCWLDIEGRKVEVRAGDIMAFPFATGHQLGVGSGGRLVVPTESLPPMPWQGLPVLDYGGAGDPVRILCGFLECDALNFAPLRQSLPPLLLVRPSEAGSGSPWLHATVRQLIAEVDTPQAGGGSMLERLTEIILIELLRHQLTKAAPTSTGWLAALADKAIGRCLTLIHNQPRHDWSIEELATTAGLSRSTLADRFDAMLGTSPMRYIREWRLYLASVALREGNSAIASIAHEARYGTEAAFNRAFTRFYGMPPAAWRQAAQ